MNGEPQDPGSVPPEDIGDDGFSMPQHDPQTAAAEGGGGPSSGEPAMAINVNRVLSHHGIVFLDIDEAEKQARAELENELYILKQQEEEDGPLMERERRIEEITAILNSQDDDFPTPIDPFFTALAQALHRMGHDLVKYHVNGRLPSQVETKTGGLRDEELAFGAVYGLLAANNTRNPGQRGFGTAVAVALGEFTDSKELFSASLEVSANEGKQRSGRFVRASQWATVVRSLVSDGVGADDPQLNAKIRIKLSTQISSADGAVPSAISIDLPDLEAQADVEIVSDNLRAMQAIHFSSMLEELRLFQVVDKLVELFQNGLLPFGRGRAGDLLYGYWKRSVNRLSEVERRNLYARGFGLPGGDASISNPNREYSDLFLRFASAVSQYVRQFTVDDLLRSSVPFRVNEEAVRKAGRDFAANLSLHGYGIAHFAATELQGQINEIIAILGDPEVRNAYGARDMWQVVDQVATLELGGARNGIRYRTMATSGAIIIRWLAERSSVLAGGYGVPLLNMAEIRRPTPRPAGSKPTTNPTDRDLVDAVEQWLAVTGTPDARVEEYSQPAEGPSTTSRPIAIPQVARDLLDSVGVAASYQGNGGGNRLAGYGVR
ncbi:MAG: hypothetical protein JWM27_1241 [Gemmatimonadetes bacterium]|nr:hypothetical protein [Gemmatimonadota bacterium]